MSNVTGVMTLDQLAALVREDAIDTVLVVFTDLRKQVEAAGALGFQVFGASELEYYIFEDSYRSNAADCLTPQTLSPVKAR